MVKTSRVEKGEICQKLLTSRLLKWQMDQFKKAFDFYVFSNIHVAAAASCFVLITLNGFAYYRFGSVAFVFFATILAYNFIRIVELDRLQSFNSNWIKSSSNGLIVLNILSLIGLLASAFNLRLQDLIVLIPFALLTLLYVVPGRLKFKGLRNVPGLKLFVIALVWAGVTALFPLLANDIPIEKKEIVVLVQRFLIVLAITIPFDIRDLALDKSEMDTLPQLLGIKYAKVIAIVAVILFDLLYLSADFAVREQVIGMVTSILSIIMILASGVYQNRYYSSFWVESIPVIWFLLLYLFP